jgi:hypothetical protein
MALVPATAQAAFLVIFTAMDAMLDGAGDAYQAAEMAAVIKTYILSGTAATVDSGVVPAGTYAGSGTGTMTVDADILEADLYTTFTTAYSNDELAAHIATDIDKACKADKTVSTQSSGIVTTGSGAVSPLSGSGEGKFTGDKTKIEKLLKTCFSEMNRMESGGNAHYAAQLAAGLTDYLKAGKISVSLKNPPFTSGSGSGAIA